MPRITVENAFIEEFIKAYKLHECLWSIRSKLYHNHVKREEGYETLRQIAEKHFGTKIATKTFVVNKIKNLRTAFKKELNKVKNCKNKTYIPKLWYYHLLHFVSHDHVPRRSKMNTLQNKSNQQAILDEGSEKNREDEEENKTALHNMLHTIKDDDTTSFNLNESMLFSDTSRTASPDRFRSPPVRNCTPPPVRNCTPPPVRNSTPPPVRNCTSNSQSDAARNTTSRMKRILDSSETEDEFDIAGKHFASQLRGLDQEQRILVEKLMADMVFEARLKRLRRSSIIWTPENENA